MRKSFLLKLLVAAILIESGIIQAALKQAPLDWLGHDTAEFAFFSNALAQGIELNYLISLGSNANALVTAVSNDMTSILNIYSQKIELSNNKDNFTNDISSVPVVIDAAAISGSFNYLATGDYYQQVSRSVVGTFGGGYLLFSNVNRVPGPESYAMLLTGLGLIGLSLRRRQTM
ncbi:FxDxF family PEP-CTERM protein [Nitrosomonas supralitoralis]|uniref:PEP-CTERM protein-sorting domain-containing protein n=1 Tax=Nitrosomonas supralitoralis TaxID=2116706 RepID=A0A2P7NXJ2_9PROT|nr:FxDxF family PEP-CTERM protein [Nitrosomonas supralitoralis]PSJ18188.1 hypothetical protein C7H79_03995 [Nitrosomonas supralitoralis]